MPTGLGAYGMEQVELMMGIRMERTRLFCKKLNFLVAKATVGIMLLAMSFMASGSDAHAANGDFVWAKSMGGDHLQSGRCF